MEPGKSLLSGFADPLPAAMWAAAGAILMHLWRRYRRRLSVLRCQAFHYPLAVSAQDVSFGTIQVVYNGNPVQNLFFTTVQVENESNLDLTNVDLNLLFQDGTTIYIAHANLQGSANPLPFADPFAHDLDTFLRLSDDDPSRAALAIAVFQRRDFRVPVLNRGAKVTIGMVVQAPLGRQPFILLACDYPGLKVIFQGPRELLYGVPRNHAVLTGIFLGGTLVFVIARTSLTPAASSLVAFMIGCTVALLGVAVIRVARWFWRLLS